MMKKVFTLLLSLTLFLTMTACGQDEMVKETEEGKGQAEEVLTNVEDSESADESASTGGEKGKIGHLSISLSSDFTTSIDNGMRKAAEEKGYELMTIDVNADPELELSSVETMLTSGVEAFYTVSVASENVWNAVQEKDSSVAIISQQPGASANAHVVEDNVGMAKMFLESLDAYMQEHNMESAKMACMWLAECESPEMSMYAGRQAILEEVNKAFEGTDNEILCEVYSSDSEGQTNNAESILNMYPECNVIFCYGSDMGVIASNIVMSAGRETESFYIFASESADEVYNQIANEQSPLRGCASGSVEDLGYNIALSLISYIETGEISDVPVPKTLCDWRNVDGFLQN